MDTIAALGFVILCGIAIKLGWEILTWDDKKNTRS